MAEEVYGIDGFFEKNPEARLPEKPPQKRKKRKKRKPNDAVGVVVILLAMAVILLIIYAIKTVDGDYQKAEYKLAIAEYNASAIQEVYENHIFNMGPPSEEYTKFVQTKYEVNADGVITSITPAHWAPE